MNCSDQFIPVGFPLALRKLTLQYWHQHITSLRKLIPFERL